MTGRYRRKLGRLSCALVVSVVLLSGCAPDPVPTREDAIGTWSMDAGGTIVFDSDGIEVDKLYVSPITGSGADERFTGSGTWRVGGKSSVAFTLTQWTARFARSEAGNTYTGSIRAVMRDGELELELFDALSEDRYYLKKE